MINKLSTRQITDLKVSIKRKIELRLIRVEKKKKITNYKKNSYYKYILRDNPLGRYIREYSLFDETDLEYINNNKIIINSPRIRKQVLKRLPREWEENILFTEKDKNYISKLTEYSKSFKRIVG